MAPRPPLHAEYCPPGQSPELHPGNVISSISHGERGRMGSTKISKELCQPLPQGEKGKGERGKGKKKKKERKKITLLSHTQYFHFITVSSQLHGNLGKILMLLLCKLGLFVLRDTSS